MPAACRWKASLAALVRWRRGRPAREDGVGAEGGLSKEMLLTDPEQAADFVKRTAVDALAIAIGTSHGAYKFSRPPTGDILAIDRVKEIHARIPNTHLVMHGSSSVPQELLARINEFGGDIPETYGVPVAEVQEGIRHGVRKVNIDTDLRLASTAAIREHLAKNRSEFDPRKYLTESMNAMKAVVVDRYEAFGTAGNGRQDQAGWVGVDVRALRGWGAQSGGALVRAPWCRFPTTQEGEDAFFRRRPPERRRVGRHLAYAR